MPAATELEQKAVQYLSTKELHDLADARSLAQELCSECAAANEAIAQLILPRRPDISTLIACSLQCMHQNDGLHKIERRFGKEVANIISALFLLNGGSHVIAPRPAGQVRRMVSSFSQNVRVLLIALHTRLYLLEHADRFSAKEQDAIARESLEIFAPLSARLGIYALKYSLETLAFRMLYKEDAADIEKKLENLSRKNGPFMSEARQILENLLRQHIPNVAIAAREKHPYSIFRKLERKSLTSMMDLYDLFGIRVIVDAEEDCYRTLGTIHNAFRPILHRMKDYIAMPKPNGYRSLHTTIMGICKDNPSFPVEVQIRTYKMDEEAEFGIAAHWNYKEKGSSYPFHGGDKLEKHLKALSELAAGDVVEHDEDIAHEMTDRIFVLTPKGDIVELPKGAGPLDFAFRVHSDIGLRYRSAKVNGAIAAINHPLENGDMVAITLWREPRPSEQWIQILKTKDGRQKLRSYFRDNGRRV